jgi:hypothetical protein
MKIHILFFIFLFNYSFSQVCDFSNKVTSNFVGEGYYLSLNIETKSYKGPIVIENNNLYYYLNKKKKYTQKKYKKILKNILDNNLFLVVDEDIFSEFQFIKVILNKKIESDFQKGKDIFLQTYFNKNVSRKGIPRNEQLVIIQKLFELKITCYTDDESGAIVFEENYIPYSK